MSLVWGTYTTLPSTPSCFPNSEFNLNSPVIGFSGYQTTPPIINPEINLMSQQQGQTNRENQMNENIYSNNNNNNNFLIEYSNFPPSPQPLSMSSIGHALSDIVNNSLFPSQKNSSNNPNMSHSYSDVRSEVFPQVSASPSYENINYNLNQYNANPSYSAIESRGQVPQVISQSYSPTIDSPGQAYRVIGQSSSPTVELRGQVRDPLLPLPRDLTPHFADFNNNPNVNQSIVPRIVRQKDSNLSYPPYPLYVELNENENVPAWLEDV